MDALLSRLPETLTALAALVAAMAAAYATINKSRVMAQLEALVEMQRTIDTAQQAKLDSITQKVDGGVTRLHDMLAAGQGALASIAQTAVEQPPAKEVVVKSGERKTDPTIPRGPK